MSEHYDPRGPQESNLTVAVAGVIAVIATIAILYISDSIHMPREIGEYHTPGNAVAPR
jgi:hypothetical protein